MPALATEHLLKDDQISFTYNYGGAHELAVSPRYTVVVNSPDLTNHFLFSYLSPDSTVLEGEFEVHLIKKYTPEPNEPDAIIIKNGKFRLKNQF